MTFFWIALEVLNMVIVWFLWGWGIVSTLCFQSRPMYFHNTVLKIKLRKRTIGWKDFNVIRFQVTLRRFYKHVYCRYNKNNKVLFCNKIGIKLVMQEKNYRHKLNCLSTLIYKHLFSFFLFFKFLFQVKSRLYYIFGYSIMC